MQKEMIDKNSSHSLTAGFSLSVIEYCKVLEAQKRFVLSNQLLKSGTSIGANSMEAQNAESKADFVHKIKIAAKEADETQYWLTFCAYSASYPDCKLLQIKLEEISKIITSILSTAKKSSPVSRLLSFFIF